MQIRRLSTIEVELYSRHFAFQSACIHVTQEFLESLSTDAACYMYVYAQVELQDLLHIGQVYMYVIIMR